MRKYQLRVLISLIAVVASVGSFLIYSGAVKAGFITNYINTTHDSTVPFGSRSHWQQPWRSYQDTMPATKILNSIGINFNVNDAQANSVAQLLDNSGFTKVRYEVNWNQINYFNESALVNPGSFATKMNSFKDNNLRPMILLNANSWGPSPEIGFMGTITANASAGATTITVDSNTASQIVPGKTGIDNTAMNLRYGILFTAVDGSNVVTLSRPLPSGVSAGTQWFSVIKYAPFQKPLLPGGAPNPVFEETMAGWMKYVDTVTDQAKAVLGNDQFDLEVWNELNFGSEFLDAANYYQTVPNAAGSGDIQQEILNRTSAWVDDPANGLPNVDLTDGFASQTPFPSGATEHPSVDAMSKHYYSPARAFPGNAAYNTHKPIDASGNISCTTCTPQNAGQDFTRTDIFTPTYAATFPEFWLTRIQTEDLVRDIGPNNDLYGITHGRNSRPGGGEMPVWMTEWNIDKYFLHNTHPDYQPQTATALDEDHFHAKSMLRFLTSHMNKGLDRVYFYSAGRDRDFGLISQDFYDAISASPGTYPGDEEGGKTMASIKRMTESFAGATNISSPRQLTLGRLDDYTDNKQFEGDGNSTDRPPLYNRDVVTFLPYQVNAHKFVIPTYVMTRNLGKVYNTSAPTSDPTRFDLPNETYRLTIDGVNGTNADITAYDPLSDASVAVSVISRSANQIVVELPLTDSPRMLTVEENGAIGDLDNSGTVDQDDVTILTNDFGKAVGSATVPAADINDDGKVNIKDLSILLQNWTDG